MNKKEIFIKKAKEVHYNENLDYSKVIYINNRTKVIIIDRDLDENGYEYGEYEMTPSNHLKGQSHPRKRGKKINNSKKYNFEELIKKFKEAHPGEYLDYSKSTYVNMHTPILIIDHDLDENGNEYGEYWQEPCVHLKGCGCKKKGNKKSSEKQRLTTKEFIEHAITIHGDKYNYSKANYVSYRTPIEIICDRHGSFFQTPEAHLQGKGCPKCGNHYSKYDDEIAEYIKAFNINVMMHDRKILNGKEIDIYIPSKKIGIEFNGLRWHTEWFGKKSPSYHLNKTLECKEKGVSLIQIFEDEYNLKKDIVFSKIAHILNIPMNLPKIMGRKCIIKEVNKKDSKEFLDKNHIQGSTDATIRLGAYFSDKLVAVMQFKLIEKGGNRWDLNRFASDNNYICQGIGGKLFKYFIRNYNPEEIKSFADRRWTINEESNVYIQLGFKFDSYVEPDYTYYNRKIDNERHHKFGFRKLKLHNKYGLPMEMTEREMVKELGYDRIWNCGLIKYVWKKEEE